MTYKITIILRVKQLNHCKLIPKRNTVSLMLVINDIKMYEIVY